MYQHIEKDEKKLTDEEIVKALECCANFSTQKDCDLCPIGVIKCFEQENLMPQLALDLIHRLQAKIEELRKAKVIHETVDYCYEDLKEAQAEIERLKEENEYLDMVAKQALTDYQNTQVQVDELTEKLGKVLSGIKADELLVAKGIEQAVKDTAKEIGIIAIQLSNMCESFYEFQNRLIDLIEVNYSVEIVQETIIPTNGVEVKQ